MKKTIKLGENACVFKSKTGVRIVAKGVIAPSIGALYQKLSKMRSE